MEEKEFKNQYNSSCRVCLKNEGDGMSALFTTTYQSKKISNMFSSSTSLEIEQGDGLPPLICTKCLKRLIATHDFQQQCLKTDRELRIELGIPPTTVNYENRIVEVDVNMPILTTIGNDIVVKIEESEILETTLPDQESDIRDEHSEMSVHSIIDPFDVKPKAELTIDTSTDGEDKLPLQKPASGLKTKRIYQCLVCKKVFNKSFNLQRHFKVHNGELSNHYSSNIFATELISSNDVECNPLLTKPTSGHKAKRIYQCLVCKKGFRKSFNLQRHFNVHKGELANHFSTNIFATEHRIEATADFIVSASDCEADHQSAPRSKTNKTYQCLLCQKVFNKSFNLQRHSKRVHNDLGKPFECEVCKFRFASEFLLIRHALQHTDIITEATFAANDGPHESTLASSKTSDHKKYKCKFCQKTFAKFHQLRSHSVMSHDEFKQYRCNGCDQKFALASQLNDHMIGHCDEKSFVCRLCNKGYLNSNTLKVHMKTHSKETLFLCSECGKAFQNNANLSQHMSRHSGNKPFACKECPSRFVTKGSLRAHMSTHSQIKPYTCDLCGATFTRNYSVTKHKRIHHTDERPFPCEMCDKRFHTSERLRIHTRTHTGEKPYRCEFCYRGFAQSNDLVKHTRTHVGGNTYKCKDCPAAFRLFRELQQHSNMHFLALKNNDETNEHNSKYTSETVAVQQAGQSVP